MNKEDFLKDLDNMSNHRILLWEALQLTSGNVVEFGSGYGSTPYLKKFCEDNKRGFESFESNREWAQNTLAKFVYDWNEVNIKMVDVLFLDHAPGERRKVDLLKYKDVAKIIVIHDSEPAGWNASDYQVRPLFKEFKYELNLIPMYKEGAWCTMLSNFIDLDHLENMEYEFRKTVK